MESWPWRSSGSRSCCCTSPGSRGWRWFPRYHNCAPYPRNLSVKQSLHQIHYVGPGMCYTLRRLNGYGGFCSIFLPPDKREWLILAFTYDVECNVMNNSTEKNWYVIFCQDVIMIMMLWIKLNCIQLGFLNSGYTMAKTRLTLEVLPKSNSEN